MKVFNKTLLLTAITMASTSAMAVNVDFSGFGTIGYIQNDESDVARAVGTTSKGSWGSMSLIGLQADVQVTDKLSATAQVKLAEDIKVVDRMQMTLQMAFLGYQVTDSLKVRIGRLRAPFYLDSEYLDVGYVKTTATTPIAVYGQAPFANYNGMDVIFTHYTASDLEIQVQPYIGKERREFDFSNVGGGGGKVDANYLTGVNVSIAGDDWKVRAGYTIGEMNNPSYQAVPATEGMFLDDDMGSFLTVGANYDNGELLATVEFAKRTVEGAKAVSNLTGAYTTIGYRFGDFTPYFTYQVQETDNKNREALVPSLKSENPAFPYLPGINSDFKALGVGFKYEFSKVALKAEVTNYEFGQSGFIPSGLIPDQGYRNSLTGYKTDSLKSAKILSLTLETVF